MGVDQFAAQQFMGKLAFPKEELWHGGRRFELPFDRQRLLLKELDHLLPALQRRDHPGWYRLANPHPAPSLPPTPGDRHLRLQEQAAPHRLDPSELSS